MVDKRESYTKEDLILSGRGELFGEMVRRFHPAIC